MSTVRIHPDRGRRRRVVVWLALVKLALSVGGYGLYRLLTGCY